jgi:hypothetical protein
MRSAAFARQNLGADVFPEFLTTAIVIVRRCAPFLEERHSPAAGIRKVIAVEVLPTLASQIREFANKQLPDGTMSAKGPALVPPSSRPTPRQRNHQADRHNRLCAHVR